ncbi:MAG: alanyl-tRNA editing protein [Blautia sp.]|nr:alanyl-tRNA editing protein [Blautia sp.]
MMETRRLYYEDVYTKEFEAEVLECRPLGKKYAVVLDKSAFYPEGGGQPSDTGFLNETAVSEVHEKDGELLHYTAEEIPAGTRVRGVIDWDRRFDLMQQHSGEHMVSGLVHAAYGYDNVGFHMGSDVITIDFNGPLTEEQLLEIEDQVNERIWENKEVRIWYPGPEELKALPYRSKKELTGDVRIVEFPGVDLCACCGTHVARTGEIGMVKLLSVVRFREGVRVEMISGRRVLQYLQMVSTQNHQVSVLLSAKPHETAKAVQHMQEENFSLRGRLQHMEAESFAAEAEKYEGKGDVLLFKPEMEADAVRRLTDAVMHTCGGRCAVFSKNPDGSFKYAMGQIDGDLRTLTKEMNAALDGRGGGKPFFVQGSVKAEEQAIRDFFSVRQTTD